MGELKPYAGKERQRIGQGAEKRSERVDIRVMLTQRRELERIARGTRRTLTSLFDELIEELIKKHPAP